MLLCRPPAHLLLAVSLGMLIFVGTATAQIEIKIFGAYQAAKDYPFAFTQQSKQEYSDALWGQDASYVLGQTPSVTFYSDSGTSQGYSYLRLRGIDQTRINMTLDGVPLNEPEDQGVYFSNYPDLLSAMSGFQLIRGVGTSQNGAASYGGSLLFESPDLSVPKSELGLSAGSFGFGRVFSQYSAPLENGQVIYLRAAELRSDGYIRRSGNDSQSLFFKWGNLRHSDQWALSGFLGHQQNELAYLGSTLEEIAVDRRHNGNSKENDNFLQSLTQIQNIRTLSSGNVLTSSVYYNHLQGNYDFDLNNFLGLPSTNELYNYDLSSQFVGAFSNYRINFGRGCLTSGLHANWYERHHTGRERTLGELYENRGTKKELSAFTKYEQNIGDFLFLSDLQVRHTSFEYHGSVPLSGLDWTFFNPKVGLTYLPTNRTNYYYSIGRTGREPTRNDIFLGNDNLLSDETGEALIGSTDAEYVLDQELGLRTKGETWSIQANAFYLDFDNEIVLNGKLGPTGLPLTDSVNRSYRSGLEATLRWSVRPDVTLETNVTLMRSRIDQDGLAITPVMSPSVLGNQALEVHWERWRLRSDLHYQSSSYIDFANNTSIGSFWTANFSAHYDLNPLDLGLHINNLFNERYFANGYVDFNGSARYFVQAPTNIFLTATWKL